MLPVKSVNVLETAVLGRYVTTVQQTWTTVTANHMVRHSQEETSKRWEPTEKLWEPADDSWDENQPINNENQPINDEKTINNENQLINDENQTNDENEPKNDENQPINNESWSRKLCCSLPVGSWSWVDSVSDTSTSSDSSTWSVPETNPIDEASRTITVIQNRWTTKEIMATEQQTTSRHEKTHFLSHNSRKCSWVIVL